MYGSLSVSTFLLTLHSQQGNITESFHLPSRDGHSCFSSIFVTTPDCFEYKSTPPPPPSLLLSDLAGLRGCNIFGASTFEQLRNISYSSIILKKIIYVTWYEKGIQFTYRSRNTKKIVFTVCIKRSVCTIQKLRNYWLWWHFTACILAPMACLVYSFKMDFFKFKMINNSLLCLVLQCAILGGGGGGLLLFFNFTVCYKGCVRYKLVSRQYLLGLHTTLYTCTCNDRFM